MTSVQRVKAICKERKIAISRLEKDLGYANGYIGQLRKGVFPDDRLCEIARYLSVSVSYLTHGDTAEPLTSKDDRDIAADLERFILRLDSGEDLMFDGDPMSDEARQSILSAMKLGLEAAKVRNKEKFTPIKYRKG